MGAVTIANWMRLHHLKSPLPPKNQLYFFKVVELRLGRSEEIPFPIKATLAAKIEAAAGPAWPQGYTRGCGNAAAADWVMGDATICVQSIGLLPEGDDWVSSEGQSPEKFGGMKGVSYGFERFERAVKKTSL